MTLVNAGRVASQPPTGGDTKRKPLLKRTSHEVRIPQHETLTPSNGVLVAIRSDKSFFEVTKDIESRLQRFSIPKLMEYVTHGDREGLEAYVRRKGFGTKQVLHLLGI